MGCGSITSNKQINQIVQIPKKCQKYLRKQILGKGTYGTVYKCIDTITKQQFAMKVIEISKQSYDKVQKQIKQLKSQITVLKKLNHPYIVKYKSFDVTQSLDQVQIVMQLVNQGTLQNYIKTNGSLNQQQCSKICKKILQALQYLHQGNIIHRDIKCANILIDKNLNPKITDFGTAKISQSNNYDDIAKLSKSLKGTPYYMAPQVLRRLGHKQSADIWSFGCTVIQMITGIPPWKVLKAQFSQIIQYIISGVKPPFPSNISKQCLDFLNCCLQPLASKRSTAKQLLNHKFILQNCKEQQILNVQKLQNGKKNINNNYRSQQILRQNQQKKININKRNIQSKNNIIKNRNSKIKTTKRQFSSLLQNYQNLQTNQDYQKIRKQKFIRQLEQLTKLSLQMQQIQLNQGKYIQKNKNKIKQQRKTTRTQNSTKQKIYDQIQNLSNISSNFSLISKIQPFKKKQLQISNYNSQINKQQITKNSQNNSNIYKQIIIDTDLSRKQRQQYIKHKQLLNQQKRKQKQKWQQQLKRQAQFLKNQYGGRYFYKHNQVKNK